MEISSILIESYRTSISYVEVTGSPSCGRNREAVFFAMPADDGLKQTLLQAMRDNVDG